MEILHLTPLAVYVVLAVFAIVMARKCLSAKRYLPFQEEAAHLPWEKVEESLRPVIVSLLQLSGIGFLMTAFLLLATIPVYLRAPTHFETCIGPAASLIFCVGLLGVNLKLHRATKAPTPWKGALIASCLLAAALVISLKTR